MDCIVFFDDALVAWERVFLLGDVELLNDQSPLAPEIDCYLATDTTPARERVKLFRLAWDIACSAFGGRQVLYERFFAGDPLSRAQSLYKLCPKKALMQRVRDFLGRDDNT